MVVKAGCLLLTLLVGSLALPLNEEQDMSVFFDYPEGTPRIIGGSSAGTVRHMVALSTGVYTSTFMCGASLISNRHVLTAAHCIQFFYNNGALLNSLRGTVGTNRWNWGGTKYQFSHNITHPNYVHYDIKNDIGILVTTANVVETNNVRPVSLSFDFIGGGAAATVNGWGRTRTGGSISSTLMALRTNVVDGAKCIVDVARRAEEINMWVPDVDPRLEICTFAAINRGNCHGDSGSALVLQSTGQQIGVVSWGIPCARDAPDMFTRVSAYRAWIERNTS